MPPDAPLSLVVLISGRGSNLATLIDAVRCSRLNLEIRGVISNRAAAGGIEYARNAGIHVTVLPHATYPDRDSFDAALGKAIDHWQPDLILLSGFMRVLTPGFTAKYGTRTINQHPSLLPLYPGLNTYQRALDAGDSRHGASIHFVTADLDSGPVIAQTSIPIHAEDTAASLAQRLQPREHQLLERVLHLFCQRRICCAHGRILLDNHLLTEPIQIPTDGG